MSELPPNPFDGLNMRSSQNYLLASSVIFYYKFILTLSQEYKYIWSRKFGIVNALIIALRYISAISYIPVLALAFETELDDNCSRLYKVPAVLGIFCQCLVLAFLVIRVFAIFDKRLWILGVTIPIALSSIILSSLAISRTQHYFFDLGGFLNSEIGLSSCFMSPDPSNESPLLFELSYIAVILFDTLICVLSVWRTGRMYRVGIRANSNSSLASILLRDGCILYVFVNQNKRLDSQGLTKKGFQVRLLRAAYSTSWFTCISSNNGQVPSAPVP